LFQDGQTFTLYVHHVWAYLPESYKFRLLLTKKEDSRKVTDDAVMLQHKVSEQNTTKYRIIGVFHLRYSTV